MIDYAHEGDRARSYRLEALREEGYAIAWRGDMVLDDEGGDWIEEPSRAVVFERNGTLRPGYVHCADWVVFDHLPVMGMAAARVEAERARAAMCS